MELNAAQLSRLTEEQARDLLESIRWNHRKVNDGVRTVAALKAADGKRLMYREPEA